MKDDTEEKRGMNAKKLLKVKKLLFLTILFIVYLPFVLALVLPLYVIARFGEVLGDAHFFDEILPDFFIARPVNFLSGDKRKKNEPVPFEWRRER
jgi:hypothetical protein